MQVSVDGLEGDAQADRRVHGGALKAVYAYPAEHYPYWASRIGGPAHPPGSFGENLTTEGWSEREACVGDVVEAGGVELEVIQPRLPCVKMELKFERPGMIAEFLESGRTGFYLRVRRPGLVRAGDAIRLLSAAPAGPTIAEIVDRARAESGN